VSERNREALTTRRPWPTRDYCSMEKNMFVSFEMWCWTKMVEISWTDRVKNEVLHRVNEERNILHTSIISNRKANWIGYI
jgi:hypothetical protein